MISSEPGLEDTASEKRREEKKKRGARDCVPRCIGSNIAGKIHACANEAIKLAIARIMQET